MPSNWTQEQKAEAARRARLNRPWLHSTGPRTTQGKRTSSRNSLKHGYFSREKQALRWYLRVCILRLKQIRCFEKIQAAKYRKWKETRNELTCRYYKWNANPLRFPQFMPEELKSSLHYPTKSG